MVLSLAHVAAVPVQNVGWTYSATIQLISLIIGTGFGGGLLWTTAKGVALLWQRRNETRQQDIDGAAAIRKEMMELNDRQTARITKLEGDLRDERRACDADMADLRKRHADEVAEVRKVHADEMRALHERIEALHRQMVQMQQTTGRAIKNGLNAPAAGSRTAADTQGIGDVLRQTFDIPGTDEEL